MHSRWFSRGAAIKVPLCACVLLLLVTGCNQGKDLDTAIVVGKVTLDGKPLSAGNVAFIPDSSKGTSGPTSSASIDENGNYRLKTAGRDGTPPGWYTVIVEIIDQSSLSEGAVRASDIPLKYSRPAASPLKREVKQGEENEINLELESGA